MKRSIVMTTLGAIVFALAFWSGMSTTAQASCCSQNNGKRFDSGCTTHAGYGCSGAFPTCAIEGCKRYWQETITSSPYCAAHPTIDPPGTYSSDTYSDANALCVYAAIPGSCYASCFNSINAVIDPGGGIYSTCVAGATCPSGMSQYCPVQ